MATAVPTVAPVTEQQADPKVKPIFNNLKQNLGKVPNFFAILAHRPEILETFLPFYQAVTGPGKVEQRYKELAYLKTSMTNGCEYCSRAHSASAKKVGIKPEEIQALTFYQRSNLFDEKDKAVIQYADQVTRGASGVSDVDRRELKRFFSDEQMVELTATIAIANFTNRINDSLPSTPDLGE
jgi:uncharacterized peroxidase-related enzyme